MELRLKKERLNRNWTQLDVAQKIKVTEAAVSAWEKGVRFPRKDKLDQLENLFGIPQRQLFSPIN